jgi:hypothetical protein
MRIKEESTNCTAFATQVWLYLDNGLPEPVRERWDAHLAVCKHCSQELAEVKELLAAYQNLADYDMDEAAYEAVVQQAIKPLVKQPSILRRRKLIYWGAPLAAAAALLLFIFLPKDRQENNFNWQTPQIEYSLSSLEEDIARIALSDLEWIDFSDVDFTGSAWDADLQYIEEQINSLAFELSANL